MYDVDRGRAWIVLVAVYAAVIIHCTILFMNGLYLAVLVENYGEDLTKTSMIGALNSAMLCLLAPVVSVFIDTYSCRICAVIGGLLLAISYFVSFFIRSINILIFTIGIIGGAGNSFTGTPQPILLSYYFDRRRNKVITFREVLVGFGMFVASPVLFWLIDMFGINGSFLIVSGLALQISVFGLLCAPNSEEKRLRESKSKIGNGKTTANPLLIMRGVKSSVLVSLRLCKDLSIISFLLSTLTWNLILSAVSLHLPRYMVKKGFNEAAVVLVMTIFGICNTLGRLCTAITVGKGGLDSYILHIGGSCVLSLTAILFPFYGSWTLAGFLFSGLCGFYTGVPNALVVKITISMVGMERLTSAYGLVSFFSGVGLLSGPPLLGIVYEATESYDCSFMTIGFIALFGALLSLVAFGGISSKKSDTNVPMNDNIVHM